MTDGFELIDGVLTFSPQVKYIRAQQFCGREDIVKVIIPEGVGFMEEECFTECSELREVTLPEGLINIGGAAFAECTKLQKINLPKTLKTVDCGAFFSCEALRELEFPHGLEEIGEYAFQGTGLRQVILPDTVTRIEECAFFSCEELRKIHVPNPDTELGIDCFGSNYKLVEGYVAKGYPDNADFTAELLYTLLWCSCHERHSAEASARAREYVKSHENLIMERILKANNVPAMTGLSELGLLSSATINGFIGQTLLSGQTELSALLLRAKNAASNSQEEFDL